MSITGVAHRELSTPTLKAVQGSNTHELPVWLGSREHPVSLECPVSLVSNGQGLDRQIQNKLKELAAANRCTERCTEKKRLWKLMRGLRAIEKGIGRELPTNERMSVFDEWYRLSQSFLDPGKTREDYLAEFLAGLGKVQVPTGDGDRLNKALEAVQNLSFRNCPLYQGCRMHLRAGAELRRCIARCRVCLKTRSTF